MGCEKGKMSIQMQTIVKLYGECKELIVKLSQYEDTEPYEVKLADIIKQL